MLIILSWVSRVGDHFFASITWLLLISEKLCFIAFIYRWWRMKGTSCISGQGIARYHPNQAKGLVTSIRDKKHFYSAGLNKMAS